MLLIHIQTFLLLGVGLAQASSLAYPRQRSKRAAYFLDNDESGNQLISLKVDSKDGTLSSPVRTSTGGTGLPNLIAVSQDSVVVSGNVCYQFPHPSWAS